MDHRLVKIKRLVAGGHYEFTPKADTTSSSRASGRSHPSERVYRRCPLCDGPNIKLSTERLTLSRRDGKDVRIRVRRWLCSDCQERFLTPDSRRRIDIALGLVSE